MIRSILVALAVTTVAAFAYTQSDTAGDVVSDYVTHVRDGDIIEVADVPIRFDGDSAPEQDEPFDE